MWRLLVPGGAAEGLWVLRPLQQFLNVGDGAPSLLSQEFLGTAALALRGMSLFFILD
jgi:hypothetical protein